MATQAKPTTTGEAVPVTADNFNRAETDKYFGDFVKRGALGKFWHFRELPSIEAGQCAAQSRHALFARRVGPDAGPVTITLPRRANDSCP